MGRRKPEDREPERAAPVKPSFAPDGATLHVLSGAAKTKAGE
jgi:hypothetical protein